MRYAQTTFADVFEKWSAEHFPKISQSNIHGYNALYKLCEPLYNMKFVDLRKSHLQNIVGHKGKSVTETVYTHLDLEIKLEAINKI